MWDVFVTGRMIWGFCLFTGNRQMWGWCWMWWCGDVCAYVVRWGCVFVVWWCMCVVTLWWCVCMWRDVGMCLWCDVGMCEICCDVCVCVCVWWCVCVVTLWWDVCVWCDVGSYFVVFPRNRRKLCRVQKSFISHWKEVPQLIVAQQTWVFWISIWIDIISI